MRHRRRDWLIGLYPKAWRDRYGDEFAALLEDEAARSPVIFDVVSAAITIRMRQVFGKGEAMMATYPASFFVMARKPSAALPLLMSLGALATVIVSVAVFGTRPEPDEGAAAHIFQLLIGLQLPFLAVFAVRWLRRDLRAGLAVLAIDGAAIGAALLPVWYFGL